jgi:hypothetical protein
VAINEALTLRPELMLARNELKIRQFNLIEAKNELLPDVRFGATYDINSIGTRLDGADANNAFRTLASDHFNNWSLVLRANVPIGYRLAHANVREARLQVERAYRSLQEFELRTGSILASYYRDLSRYYDQISIQRSQREAYGEQLRARFEELIAGKTTVDVLLEAQRFWAQALAAEYQNIYLYNATLARFEHAKGTILLHDNVLINEGPLPECARERAAEYRRQRERALVVAERADAGAYQKCGGPACECTAPAPAKQGHGSLEGLFESVLPVGKGGAEQLPGIGEIKKPDDKPESEKTEEKSAVIPAGAEMRPPIRPSEQPPIQSLPKPDDSTPPAGPPLPPPTETDESKR